MENTAAANAVNNTRNFLIIDCTPWIYIFTVMLFYNKILFLKIYI